MGFRLYLEDASSNAFCCGKLYGYVDDAHLQSLQYLVDIGAMDAYIDDMRGDYTLYEKANIMIDSLSRVDVTLRQREFRTFLLLYFIDRYQYYIDGDHKLSEVFDEYNSFIELFANNPTIDLIWC